MGARYSRHAGYTVARRQSKRSVSRTVSRKFRFGPTTAKYLGLGVLAVIALVAATQSNSGVTRDYQQAALTKQLSQNNATIEAMKLEAKREQSLSSVAQSSEAASMVPVTDVTHVPNSAVPSPSPSPVAKP